MYASNSTRFYWDHPHACGEKDHHPRNICCEIGSPPRVRGKDSCSKSIDSLSGITPARAGKSASLIYRQLPCRDHPRACGEKEFDEEYFEFGLGSPPRVRGKEI